MRIDSGGAATVQPTLPIRYLVELARRARVGRQLRGQALAAAGVTERALDRPGYRITAAAFEKFHRLICRSLGDEMAGFFERPVPIGTYATLIEMLTGLPDVAACIEASNQFYRLFDRHRYWVLAVDGGWGHLTLETRDRDQASSIVLTHGSLLAVWRTMSWISGRSLVLDEIRLPPRFRRYAGETRDLFRCAPVFEPGPPRLRFDAAVARLPVARAAGDAKQFARVSFLYLFGPAPTRSLRDELRAVLAVAQPFAGCKIGEAARRLGMSRATLARRLQRQGLTFQSAKDELRRDQAIALLASGPASVAEIAERVGFSEPSAFARAFRDWTGLSPGAFRAERLS